MHEHNDNSIIFTLKKYRNKNKLKFVAEFERNEKNIFNRYLLNLLQYYIV
jgi:hypothetical protein